MVVSHILTYAIHYYSLTIILIYIYIHCILGPSEYQKRASNTFGIPYDYYSVMHYSQRSCSRGGPTMTFPKGVDASRVGREEWLTASDIENIKKRYCQQG